MWVKLNIKFTETDFDSTKLWLNKTQDRSTNMTKTKKDIGHRTKTKLKNSWQNEHDSAKRCIVWKCTRVVGVCFWFSVCSALRQEAGFRVSVCGRSSGGMWRKDEVSEAFTKGISLRRYYIIKHWYAASERDTFRAPMIRFMSLQHLSKETGFSVIRRSE